jgi:acetyl-CoA synthetase
MTPGDEIRGVASASPSPSTSSNTPSTTGDEAKAIAKELRDWVAKEIGPIAKPKDIRFGDNLPKTRSGKIMRRLLRSIAKGEAITQDTSTLENPAILDQLSQTN